MGKMKFSLSDTLWVLRMGAGAALAGACVLGLVMGLAGYRGADLEAWRTVGAGVAFLPGILFGRAHVRSTKESSM